MDNTVSNRCLSHSLPTYKSINLYRSLSYLIVLHVSSHFISTLVVHSIPLTYSSLFTHIISLIFFLYTFLIVFKPNHLVYHSHSPFNLEQWHGFFPVLHYFFFSSLFFCNLKLYNFFIYTLLLTGSNLSLINHSSLLLPNSFIMGTFYCSCDFSLTRLVDIFLTMLSFTLHYIYISLILHIYVLSLFLPLYINFH